MQRIIDFYHRQNTDYADYFQAAWRFKHRAALGQPRATLADIAADAKVSAKYLATVWDVFEGPRETVGPIAKLQAMLARAAGAGPERRGHRGRAAARRMRDYVDGAAREGRAAVPQPRSRRASTRRAAVHDLEERAVRDAPR